ncbi:MAG: DUF5615 family PIN-like protein [Bacteroidota bacterium]
MSPATVAFIRSAGHDALHLREQGLQRLPDVAIMDKARAESRIVLTHDLDFGDLLAASGDALPSVVIFRLGDMRPANVNRHLAALLADHPDALNAGAVVSVSERRARIRRLPI